MTEPTASKPIKPTEFRQPTAPEPQTAVVPLNTVTPEDLGAGTAVFDQWLRSVGGDYLTLERLATVAGSLPVLGNVMALVDVLMDLVRIVEKTVKKQVVDFLDWVDLAINLIGVIPLPPGLGAARMTLRPTLHLVQQKLAQGGKDLGQDIVIVLTAHLHNRLAGEQAPATNNKGRVFVKISRKFPVLLG